MKCCRRREKCDEAAEDNIESENDLLYSVDETPPWHLCMLLSLQQYLMTISGVIMLPLLVMNVICFDDSQAANLARTKVLGTVLVVCGISTLLQTTLGLRLPTFQGITIAYFIPTVIIMGTDKWKCPAPINFNLSSLPANLSVFSVDTNSSSSQHLTDHSSNMTLEIDTNYYHYYIDNDGEFVDSNELWAKRIREVQGAIIISSLIQIFIGFSGFIGFVMQYIGPLTITPILVLVTISLKEITAAQARTQWGIALLFVAIFILCNIILKKITIPFPLMHPHKKTLTTMKIPIFEMFPILIAVVTTWLLCYIITVAGGFPDDPTVPAYQARTDTKPGVVSNSPWFRLPYPFQWGTPTFSVIAVFGMFSAIFPGIFESLGVYMTCSEMCRQPPPPKHAINRAVLMEGFGMFFAGLFGNGNSTTSFMDSAIAVGISRVASRRVLQGTGCILIFTGLFTKFCSLFVSLPSPVIGGVLLSVLGMIASVSIAMLRTVDLRSIRNLFVLGFSIFFGLVVSVYAADGIEDIDVGVPEINNVIAIFLQIPMFIGGAVALALDNLLPGSRESRGLFHDQISSETKGMEAYDPPCCVGVKGLRLLPLCPDFVEPTVEEYGLEEEAQNFVTPT
ncbi:solute carrier family 23 member 1-like [Styela clava]